MHEASRQGAPFGPARATGRRLVRTAAAAIAAAAWAGCGTITVDEYETCSLDFAAFDADPADGDAPELSGAAGDTIVLVGGPLTEVRDTHVELGGEPAAVAEVTRAGCEDCDQCRDDAGCAPCGLCAGVPLEPAYRTTCFGDPLADPPVVGSCAACVETLSFVVPDGVPAGWTSLWVVNRNGQSETIPFLVLGAIDTGATDTAATDTADTDTGTGTTGTTGTGTTDTAATDTGSTT